MNRLFDTSVNVGLRQFYVLGAAGSIGNLFGFVGNVYIYGLSAPTIFCALCTLVIFGMTFWGIRSRHVKRAEEGRRKKIACGLSDKNISVSYSFSLCFSSECAAAAHRQILL